MVFSRLSAAWKTLSLLIFTQAGKTLLTVRSMLAYLGRSKVMSNAVYTSDGPYCPKMMFSLMQYCCIQLLDFRENPLSDP